MQTKGFKDFVQGRQPTNFGILHFMNPKSSRFNAPKNNKVTEKSFLLLSVTLFAFATPDKLFCSILRYQSVAGPAFSFSEADGAFERAEGRLRAREGGVAGFAPHGGRHPAPERAGRRVPREAQSVPDCRPAMNCPAVRAERPPRASAKASARRSSSSAGRERPAFPASICTICR